MMIRAMAVTMRLALGAGLLAGFASVAPAQTQTAPPPTAFPVAGAAPTYQVGAGDVLGINVYRMPGMSTIYAIEDGGKINFAELGPVIVDGLTVGQISELLARRLKSAGLVVNPSVSVVVSQLHAKVVTVMGAVAKPGQVALDKPNMALSAVLAQAGTVFGTGNAMVTIAESGQADAPRAQVRIADIVSGKADRALRGGEVLTVGSAPTVYVSGEVGHPGLFPLEPDMTVGQALSAAGWITPRGTRHRMSVLRKLPDGTTKRLKVKMEDPVLPNDQIEIGTRIF